MTPQMIELKSLVAKGMTPAAAMIAIEKRHHTARMPESNQGAGTPGGAKDADGVPIYRKEVLSHVTDKWQLASEIAAKCSFSNTSAYNNLAKLHQDGKLRLKRVGRRGYKYYKLEGRP